MDHVKTVMSMGLTAAVKNCTRTPNDTMYAPGIWNDTIYVSGSQNETMYASGSHNHILHICDSQNETINVPGYNNDTLHVPGTAAGHAIVATSFILMGFLDIIAAHHRYYTCLRRSTKFVSFVDIPLGFLPGRLKTWPLLAIFKILLGSVYLAIELITATYRRPGGDETPYWIHDTQAAVFILSGAVDIFSSRNADRHKNCSANVYLPDGSDYLVFAAAFGIQAGLLLGHLDGRMAVDVRAHQFYALLATACFLTVIVEAKFRHHPMFPVMRGYAVMLLGTWMYNLLIVLYHPGWDEPFLDLQTDGSVAMVSLQFTYHVIFNMALVLVVNLTFVYVYNWPENTSFSQPFGGVSISKTELDRSESVSVELTNSGAALLNNMYDVTHRESLVEDIESENEFEMMAPVRLESSKA